MSKLTAIYSRIMKLEKRVRFAALVDENGSILDGGMREGIEPIEPLEKTPELIAKLVSVQKAEDLAEFFGKPEYSILVHEDVIALIFRLKRRFVLVTADRRLSLSRTASIRRLAMIWDK